MAGRLTTNPKKLRYSYEVGLETGLQAIENWNAMKFKVEISKRNLNLTLKSYQYVEYHSLGTLHPAL